MIVITSDNAVIWNNQAAVDFDVAQDEFSISGGYLNLADRRAAGDFKDFCVTLKRKPGAWLFRPRNSEDTFIFRGERLTPANAEPSIALLIYRTGHSDYLWADFGGLFGLTHSEERIIKLLLDGQSVDELGDALSISVETVRTHVRRAYAKLGVSNRGQLFHKILGFRVV